MVQQKYFHLLKYFYFSFARVITFKFLVCYQRNPQTRRIVLYDLNWTLYLLQKYQIHILQRTNNRIEEKDSSLLCKKQFIFGKKEKFQVDR